MDQNYTITGNGRITCANRAKVWRNNGKKKRTESFSKTGVGMRELLPKLYPERSREAPTCRAECPPNVPGKGRRCPWAGCKYHLYLDVKPNGSIVIYYPDLLPHELPITCALDVADFVAHYGSELSINDLGYLFNFNSRRAHQELMRAQKNFREGVEREE